MSEDPYALRHKISRILKAARNDAGLTLLDVAAKTMWSSSKLSRIESGERAPALADVNYLAGIYDVSPEIRDGWLRLAMRARQRPEFDEFSDILSSEEIQFYAGLLTSSRALEQPGLLLPMLLRTNDYHRAVLAASPIRVRDIDRRMSLHAMACSQFLIRKIDFHLVINESALVRAVGGARVMADELEHLLRLAQEKHILVYVLPHDAGWFPGLLEPFTVMRSRADDTLIRTPNVLSRDPDWAAMLISMFDRMTAQSRVGPEAAKLIDQARGGFKG